MSSFFSGLLSRFQSPSQSQVPPPPATNVNASQQPRQQIQTRNSIPRVQTRANRSSSSNRSFKQSGTVINLSGEYNEAEGAAVPGVGASGVWINMILDESGSMQPVTDTTIENFNKYINEQKALRVKKADNIAESVLNAVAEVEVEEADVEQTVSESASSSISSSISADANQSPTPVGGPSDSVSSADTETKESDPDACYVSLTKFDAPSIYSVYERTNLPEVPSLSYDTYHPNGGTNLMDAIGAVIQRVDAYLLSVPEVTARPGVLVVIITDGQENSSKHFSSDVIKRMVSARQAAGWTFVFLGANIDAWAAAQNVGISQSNAFNFSVHKQANMVSALCESTSRYRGEMKAKKECISKLKSSRAQARAAEAWNSKQESFEFFQENERQYEESS